MQTFEQFLATHNVPTAPASHGHATPGWLNFDCPYCGNGGGSYHMGYKLAGGYVSCWRCGRHPLAATVALLLGVAPRAAKGLLQGVARRQRAFVGPVRGNKLWVPPRLRSLGRLARHRAYLRGRGFNPRQLARLWGLRGTGSGGVYAWRVWVPYYFNGEVVSWTMRAIGTRGDRYVSAKPEHEVIARSELLYGWDYVRHAVLIVEGQPDVWAIGPGAAATGGVGYTAAQIRLLGGVANRFVCFDPDGPGAARAVKLCNRLAAYPGNTEQILLEGYDPGDAPDNVLADLRTLLK